MGWSKANSGSSPSGGRVLKNSSKLFRSSGDISWWLKPFEALKGVSGPKSRPLRKPWESKAGWSNPKAGLLGSIGAMLIKNRYYVWKISKGLRRKEDVVERKKR